MFKNRFLFIGITLVCSLAVAQTTFMKKLDVDFINLDNSTISTTGSNTNLTLDPVGSGKIYLNATVNNSALTASRVVVSDSSKDLTSSSVTSTELGYVSGVTSAIQTQIDTLTASVGSSSVNSSSIPTTDNVIVRYDSTSGRLIQSTGITVDDSNVVSGITQLNVDNLRLDGNTVSSTNTDGNIVFDPNGAGIVDAGSSTLQIGTGSSTANVIQVNHGSSPKPYLKWNNTDSTWYFSGDGSSESAFGSGSGGINHIDNPDAEASTTGWSTYNDDISAASSAGLVTEGTDTVNLSNSFVEGEKIVYYSSGTDIAGLTSNTVYYAKTVTSTTFQLANSVGGSVFNLTDDGVGTHYFKQIRPLDGTGGSADITWTRTTSSPLRGSGSFLFTQDSATVSRAGHGVSYDFSIDSADKGMPLSISFNYVASTGSLGDAYSESGLRVYIYDVTNSAMIEPNSAIVPATGNGVFNKYIGNFQSSSSSTSYRLIIHCSQTTPSSLAVKIDNVVVGPEKLIYGPPMTNEKSYTPTGNWSSNTTYAGTWSRNGELAEVNVTVSLSGAPSGNMTFTSAQILNGTGLSLDTTKLAIITGNMSRALGHGTVFDSGTTSYVASAYWSQTDSVIYVTTAANNIISATNPMTFASGDRVVLRLYLPIAGWSSSVEMSSDTDTRVIAVKATGDAASASSGNPVIFPTLSYGSGYDTGTGRYTVPISGYYKVHGFVNSANAGVLLSIYKNASADTQVGSTDSNGELSYTGTVYCVAGDILDVRPNGTLDVGSGSTVYFERISGPSTIAATEKIQAVYKIASGVSSSTTAPIDFATKVTDSHSAVTTGAAWKFTAPASGTYLITASGAISSGTAEIRVYKNGSDAGLVLFDANATYSLSGSAQINLVAGDYIDLRSASSVTMLNNSRYNISIARIK